MMFNNWRTFSSPFVILFMFFITSAAFGQQPDAGLTHSQFMQVIDRIDKVEENMRNYVDQKFGELDKKIDKLDKRIDELDKRIDEFDKEFSEEFKTLNEKVAYTNGQLDSIRWGITIFGAPLLVSIVAGMVIIIIQNNISNKRETKVATEVAAEVATKVATEILTQGRIELEEDVRQGV